MSTFTSYDGTELAYHVIGEGEPLICLPGGPMRPSAYLGDLGGLAASRQLILLDHRGTGDSARAADPETYRIDRMVADVEALRAHLGLESADFLGHSAGANLVMLYAVAYPERVRRLVLITPGMRAVGISVTDAERRAAFLAFKDEPWFADAFAAYERVEAGEETDEDWDAIEPFFYGRWDEAAQTLSRDDSLTPDAELQEIHYSENVFDIEGTCAGLAELDLPVLILAGERDSSPNPVHAMQLGEMFVKGWVQLAVQPGAGHYPWLDDAEWFRGTVSRWLDEA